MNETKPFQWTWRVLLLSVVLFGLSAYAAVRTLAGTWHVDPVPVPPAAAPFTPDDLPAPEPEVEPSSQPWRLDASMTRPVPLDTPRAHYTETARRAGIQGVVIIEAVIDEKGRVEDTRVLKSLPMGLDGKAVEAVRSWRFKPATRDGKPVKVFYVLVVSFKLKH